MKCPVCREITPTLAERQGMDIDSCSRRRGVWPDRGGLENRLRRAERGPPARSVHPAEYRHGGESQWREAGQRGDGKRRSPRAGMFD